MSICSGWHSCMSLFSSWYCILLTTYNYVHLNKTHIYSQSCTPCFLSLFHCIYQIDLLNKLIYIFLLINDMIRVFIIFILIYTDLCSLMTGFFPDPKLQFANCFADGNNRSPALLTSWTTWSIVLSLPCFVFHSHIKFVNPISENGAHYQDFDLRDIPPLIWTYWCFKNISEK